MKLYNIVKTCDYVFALTFQNYASFRVLLDFQTTLLRNKIVNDFIINFRKRATHVKIDLLDIRAELLVVSFGASMSRH